MPPVQSTHPSEQEAAEFVALFVDNIKERLDRYKTIVGAKKVELESFVRANNRLYRHEKELETTSDEMQAALNQVLRARVFGAPSTLDREARTALRVMCLQLYHDSRATVAALRSIVGTSSSLSKALLEAKQAEEKRIDADLVSAENTIAILESKATKLGEKQLESEKKTADLEARRRGNEEAQNRERTSLSTAQNSTASQGAVAGAIAAAICQVVSGLFFVIALRAQRFLSQTMVSVLRSASHREALSLLSRVQNAKERDRLRGVLICNLAGVRAPETPASADKEVPAKGQPKPAQEAARDSDAHAETEANSA